MAFDQDGSVDLTTITTTGDITDINQVHDDLYVKFHDGLYDLICTNDINTAEEKSLLLKQTLTAQVTALEASAANRIRHLSALELPPEIRGCITFDAIRPAAPTRKLPAENAVGPLDNNEAVLGCGDDFDERDDEDEEEESYSMGRGRLASLLSVQGYGLDANDFQQYKRPHNQTKYMQQRRLKRKLSESEIKEDDELSNLGDSSKASAWQKVLRDSAAVRKEFKEEFDSDFFPRSYQVTEIYLPRTIYEKHSLRYKAKKRIRPDRDTLSGLIVTLRKDPPPWGFV